MCNDNIQFQMAIPKISRRRSRSSDYAELHFTFRFCRGRQRNLQIYDARAQLLFCSLNLLFGVVLVVVVVVISLKLPVVFSRNFLYRAVLQVTLFLLLFLYCCFWLKKINSYSTVTVSVRIELFLFV